MKRKTWMISALMYAMVFMACFGVLHVLKTLMEPSGPVSVESRESGGPESTREAKTGEEWEEPAGPALATDSQAQEPQDEVIRQEGYKEWKKKFPGMWTPPQAPEEPYIPPRLILATDLHYQSALAGDGGEAFRLFVERSDGKVVQYLPELLEAFLDEVIEERPSALVLSGDITMNGERLNHEELAARLKRVQDAGIQVLVIPGNHDINNHDASVYYGARKEPAPYIDGPEFHDIYHEYGYDQALSRDDSSLSYVYALDDRNWLLMLDSCQYEPDNKVEGRLKDSTMAWADEQLARAKEEGVFVIPIAHHNLLAQSRMYTTQCAMDNNKEVISLLQKYELPLFFSGHLHVQHFMRNNDIGIYEVVTSSLSTPPCQYGVLDYMEDETFYYYSRKVDMEKWARKNKSTDENLLNFDTYSPPVLKRIFYNQAYDAMKNSAEEETGSVFVKLTESEKQQMAKVYGDINAACYAGRAYEVVKEAVKQPGYAMWKEYCYPAILYEYLEYIIEDAVRDYNVLSME